MGILVSTVGKTNVQAMLSLSGNRYEAINREAEALGVKASAAPAGRIESVHARLSQLQPAISSAQAYWIAFVSWNSSMSTWQKRCW